MKFNVDLSLTDAFGLPDCFFGPASDQCSGTPAFSDAVSDGVNDCCAGLHLSDLTMHYKVDGVTGCEPCK